MSHFVHPQGICETSAVGEGTRIWAFAHVLPGARIGRDCNLCDHVFVENDVVLGDRVTVKCGVQLWDGLHVEDDVFIGPNASFTNDRMPRSKQYQKDVVRTRIARGASIGANATVLPGVKIGTLAMVGAGSVVTHDVPPHAIVMGNPGRITGYVNALKSPDTTAAAEGHGDRPKVRTLASGTRLHALKQVADLRGSLSVGEFLDDLPFVPQRYFVVFDVPSKHVRGEHAHRVCQQFLVCVHGSVAAVTDNGCCREEIVLNQPNLGLYVPPMIWCTQYKYSSDAVLLVFASEKYDPADYIRDYEEFSALVAAREAWPRVTETSSRRPGEPARLTSTSAL
jgi:acetyltransferase-like isoleucine patch superfamily enzyme/dTDP-4-dehydrorhamnose 3,5-epimerase-like enzyme